MLFHQIHRRPEFSRKRGIEHGLSVSRCTGGVKIIQSVEDILKCAGWKLPGKALVKAEPLPLAALKDAQIAILGKRKFSPRDRIFADSVQGLLLSSKRPSRPISSL